MTQPETDRGLFGLGSAARDRLIERFRGQRSRTEPASGEAAGTRLRAGAEVPEAFTRFDRHPGYEKLLVSQAAGERMGLENPFFRVHEGVAAATTRIAGREHVNFSSYNYLGLNGHPRVNKAAKDAIDRYGTSPSASRLVAGERPVHRELEEALASFHGTEDCVVFVSGHATNVSTIGYLFGPRDLILHDALIHNSALEGIRLSGAHRRSFPHNDWQTLDRLLGEMRAGYERVLVLIEGLYSMDGDIPDLPRFVDIRNRHKTFLMVDEAHSLGVLGDTGRGLAEHWHVPPGSVDLWMGTLSKTLAGCGGYIAGERALVEHLKYAAPGFVYSVGMSPPVAAAALEALRIVEAEPERVHRLRQRSRLLGELARARGVDTGLSQGYAVVPAIIGNSLRCARVSNELFRRGFNVLPIVYPAVEEKAARLRMFVSSTHSEAQVRAVVDALGEILER